jgi:glycosyltransferase involved in cell wall biosynthesis
MLIGIDGTPLNQQLTGVGHYTLELAWAMALAAPNDQFELISPRPYLFEKTDDEGPHGLPPNLSLLRAPANFLTRRWWSIGLPRYLSRNSIELFHGTNFEVPLWLTQKLPTVLTIHDLSLLLHADTHRARLARRARRMLPLMTRAATMIITPTENVKSELCEHLRISPDKVVAIPEAARRVFRPMLLDQAEAIRNRLGIGDDFLLFVGTIEPRKDLSTLVRAFEEITRARESGLQLIIAGQQGWLVDDLLKQIDNSPAAERIKLTGYLSDEALRALYSTCRIFIYPSAYEGFGLPPLEAMACGAPVIATRIASIIEVCRDAALMIEPGSVAALTKAISDLLDDEDVRRQLSSAGLRRAAEFSWQRTAQLTRAVYDEAIKRFQQRS